MEDHDTRRKIILEWMALPKDKRHTEDQAGHSPKRRPNETSSIAVDAIRTINFGAIHIRKLWDGFCLALESRDLAAQPAILLDRPERPLIRWWSGSRE
jgi:hypothetical protein